LKFLLFQVNELVDTCIEYELEAMYRRQTNIFHFSQGEKFDSWDYLIGCSYINCFYETIRIETRMSLEEVMKCIGLMVREDQFKEKLQLINDKCRQIKPVRNRLGESAELSQQHSDLLNRIQG